MTLSTPIAELKGVGEILAKMLAGLGIHNLNDLITNYPRRYDDYSQVVAINKLRPGQVTIEAKIGQVRGRYARRGLHITEAVASDETGSVRLIWFNQPYRAGANKHDQVYFIAGEYELRRGRFSILNPSVELVSDFPVNTARVIPIYREARGLKSHAIRRLIREAIGEIKDWPEHLPNWLTQRQKLLDYPTAVKEMHFPSTIENLDLAKRRLGFEEVFELSLAALLNKHELYKNKSIAISFKESLAKDFVAHLPFKLTDAQRKAAWRIYQDLAKTQPMNRLLEGDVGSGKTVVAAMAALIVMNARPSDLGVMQGSNEERVKRTKAYGERGPQAADIAGRQELAGATGLAGGQGKAVRGSGELGYQVAFMAPTEILARQHAETLYQLLNNVGCGGQVGLLIGGLKPKAKQLVRGKIKSGDIKLMVGTHALISEQVDMHKLGLVIIDEQHRFGVEQRKKLQAKAGHMPHVLHMTATPIPRSLALTLYGELDISILNELPAGRKKIITEICSPNSRLQLYRKIEKELTAGRQMFVVCPLILDSEISAGLSVEEVHKHIKSAFKNRRVAMLHGRMKSEEKDKVMRQFLGQEYDILVSTTVIEVGVDVPNATIMLIEGAERFGLAQIHQLRGRVGRSEHQSYAYLMMSDSKSPSQRLRALETTTDGFKLADLDLKLRGPGAIYGNLQHGALDLRVASLTDTRLIAAARGAAQEFIDKKEKLAKFPHLAERVTALRAVTNLN